MLRQIILKTVLLVISTACVANADMVPGLPAPLPGYQEPGPGGDYGPQPSAPPPIMPADPSQGGYQQPANPYEPNPYEPSNPYEPQQPNRPDRPGRPDVQSREVKQVYLGRSVRNERLPLRQLVGLDARYNGSEVIAVRANVRPDNPGRTVVQLVADGRVVATQINPGYQINLIPNQRIVLGYNARALQLIVIGSTFVDTLQVEVMRGQQPPPPPPPPPYQQNVELNIYRSMVGNDRVDLTQYFNLAAYRGYAVTQVIVSGSAQFQVSFVTLLVNSFNMGQLQFNGGYSQTQPIYLSQRPIIGQGADSLVLATQGNMTIEHVTLVLAYQR